MFTGRTDEDNRPISIELRPLSEVDLIDLEALFQDPFVCRYLCDGAALNSTQVKAILSRSNDTFADQDYGLWSIRSGRKSGFAGICGLYTFFEEPQPQLLYALLPEFTGKSLAYRACRRVLRHWFITLDRPTLDLSFDEPNIESRRLAERLGFRLLRQEIVESKPTCFYRLNRSEWTPGDQEDLETRLAE